MEYIIKVDDLLITMLKDYHEIEPSEVFSFFGARLKEASTIEPNITNNSKRRSMVYDRGLRTTVPSYAAPSFTGGSIRFSVLRGFYPNTKIPFKLVVVLSLIGSKPYGKVTFGVKDEFTVSRSEPIEAYNTAIAEATLLGKEIEREHKVFYKFKQFKCMRPKGMLLYKKGK